MTLSIYYPQLDPFNLATNKTLETIPAGYPEGQEKWLLLLPQDKSSWLYRHFCDYRVGWSDKELFPILDNPHISVNQVYF